MPKLKTNKAASKRFRVSANGKILKNSAFSNHILTKKTSKRKRRLRQAGILEKTEHNKVRAMLPYAF